MKSISFSVYDSPVVQPRQRHTALMKDGQPVVGRGGRPIVVNYTPKTAHANQWKTDIKTAALRALWGETEPLTSPALWEGPIILTVDFYLPRPAKLCRKKDPPGAIPHAGHLDLDNLYKAVADALNGVIYKDDGQIFDARPRKFYHEIDGRPRATIRIEEIEG